MPTFNSALYTQQIGSAGQSLNVNLPQYRDGEGKPRVLVISYTALGTEVTADTVNLCILPVNAKVLASKGNIQATATVGTAVTVRVGDSTAANRYAGTIDISAGGPFLFTATAGVDTVTPTAITTEASRIVVLTFVAITAITAGKIITVNLEYLTPN